MIQTGSKNTLNGHHPERLCIAVSKILVFCKEFPAVLFASPNLLIRVKFASLPLFAAYLPSSASSALLYPKFLLSCEEFHAALTSFQFQLWRPENLEEQTVPD